MQPLFKCWPQHVCISAYVLIVWLLSRNSLICLYSFKKREEEKKSVRLICMKASHGLWKGRSSGHISESYDKCVVFVCTCVCVWDISRELYDKTHQQRNNTVKWRRRGENGWRERLEKKWMTQGGRFYFSFSQWGPLGKVVRHNANMSVWIARWEEDSCLRWQRWLLMLNLSASPQTYSHTHTHTHSHNDHNELATKHKCATNTYTVHTCHLCMREWQARFLCCAFMGKISCL